MRVNNTQAQSPSPATNMMDSGTTILLILIAVLAVVTVAGVLYGAHLKRRRAAGLKEFEMHAEAAGQQAAPEGDDASPAPDAAAAPDAQDSAADDTAVTPPRRDADPAASVSDITLIKGLGPKLAARLNELGVTRLDQIAALTPDGVDKLDAQLGEFAGRITRDRWIEQAKLLAAGDRAGFEAAFGRL